MQPSWRVRIRPILTGEKTGVVSKSLVYFLAPFSWLYRQSMHLRRQAYLKGRFRPWNSPVPVISVGNIAAGGTGKTPFIIYLAELLSRDGHNPAILTRGYGNQDPNQADEVQLLKYRCPGVKIYPGKDRIANAKQAVASGADCLLLDDGFQHLQLERNLDIVLIDANHPVGNGFTLPAGILREGLSSLTQADLIVVTRCERSNPEHIAAASLMARRYNSVCPVMTAKHQPIAIRPLCSYQPTALNLQQEKQMTQAQQLNIDIGIRFNGDQVSFAQINSLDIGEIDADELSATKLHGRQLAVISGIAEPTSFNDTLLSLGADIQAVYTADDHADYNPQQVQEIINFLQQYPDAQGIVTEKDAVKLSKYPELASLWVLAISLTIDQERILQERLRNVFTSS